VKHFFRRVLGFDDLKEKIERLEAENKTLKKQMQEVDDCLFPFITDNSERHWYTGMGEGENWLRQRLLKITGMGILKAINIDITDHCNLNCCGCNAFSPLSEPKFLSLEEFENDILQLSKLTNKLLQKMFLLGGEPLLHPQFLDFVKLSRIHFPKTKLQIITNGILLAKQDNSFWKILHDNAVSIAISNYPIDIKIPLIKEKAKIYDVNIDITAEYRDDYRQIHFAFDLEGCCDPQESFLQCLNWSTNCARLKNGKIYLCPVCAHVDIFNNYFKKKLVVTSDDCIDIYKVQNINEILQFLAGPKPFCRYCNTKKIVGLQKWQPGRKEISEWT
jgi:MoaA/NifB/PqqE/SkfB family radical SAM enzyme